MFVRAGLLVLTLAFATPAWAQGVRVIDNPSDPVVALVDGQPILRSDVVAAQRLLPAQFQQLPLEMLFPAMIDRLITGKLLASEGRKDKLEADDEVRRQVRQFEERVIQEVYLTRRIDAVVTEEKLRERYERHIKENPAKEQISARHILVQTEAQAREVLAELRRGADFGTLAGARSIDPSGRQQGGDRGFFSREDMVPEFSEAAFALADGAITQNPVRTQFGWHVIKVEARRTSSTSYEDMREQLTNDMSQDAYNDIIAKLRSTAKIERFNLDGTPAAR
jgi:peptidyl-prolyl cis-trans isomerase C